MTELQRAWWKVGVSGCQSSICTPDSQLALTYRRALQEWIKLYLAANANVEANADADADADLIMTNGANQLAQKAAKPKKCKEKQ